MDHDGEERLMRKHLRGTENVRMDKVETIVLEGTSEDEDTDRMNEGVVKRRRKNAQRTLLWSL